MNAQEKNTLFSQIIQAGINAGTFPERQFYEGVHEGLYDFMKSICLEEEFFGYCWDLQDKEPDVWKMYIN